MSMYAGVMKRFFSAIVDYTVIIALTWLLFLFPFQQIIGKAVDSDYKNNVKIPYNEISESYTGTTSYFGSSTDGYFQVLGSYLDSDGNLKLTVTQYKGYKVIQKTVYDNAIENAKLIASIDEGYSSSTNSEKQFYNQVYAAYCYLAYGYQVKNNFPQGEDGVLFESRKGVDLTEAEVAELTTKFKDDLKADFAHQSELFLQALKYYSAKNPEAKIESTNAYKYIASTYETYSEKKTADISSTFTTADEDSLVASINAYYDFAVSKTTYDTTGKAGDDTLSFAPGGTGGSSVTYQNQAYTCFYYDLANEQFVKQLPYYDRYQEHLTWTIVYCLCFFTLAFSIYTVAMRGNTLGRMAAHIQLVGPAEKEKLNPLRAILHDVPFNFLYVLILFAWLWWIAIIIWIIFLVVDIIMILLKPHRCIRDYISGTKVIEKTSY